MVLEISTFGLALLGTMSSMSNHYSYKNIHVNMVSLSYTDIITVVINFFFII